MTKSKIIGNYISRSEDFEVSDQKIVAIINLHIVKEYDKYDPVWQNIPAKADTRRLSLRRWVHRIINMGRNARNQIEVRSGYERVIGVTQRHWKNLSPT